MANRILDLPDQAIVSGIRSGDTEMFERLFTAYWPPLCAFAAVMTRDDDDARELVADLFATLWERHADWSVTGSVESYLFVAVRNRVRTAQRDTTRRSALLQEQMDIADALLPGHHGSPTTTSADDTDLRLTVEQAIAKLPARYQTAIYLRWRRDLDYPEIARILETTPAAAKKLVNRATAVLREQLGTP